MGTQIIVVGDDAAAAVADLAAVHGLRISPSPVPLTEPHKTLDPETITALITGVVGSAASVAQLVLDWRTRQRSDGSAVEGVVIERDGYRVSLDEINGEQLVRLLRDLDDHDGPS